MKYLLSIMSSTNPNAYPMWKFVKDQYGHDRVCIESQYSGGLFLDRTALANLLADPRFKDNNTFIIGNRILFNQLKPSALEPDERILYTKHTGIQLN